MRQGRIGWLAAVVAGALVCAGSIRAAAPPGNVVVVETKEGPLDPVAALIPQEGGFIKLAHSPAVCSPGLDNLLATTVREFTIVVRIEDRSSTTGFFSDPLAPWFRSPIPPLHAVSRTNLNSFDREQEACTVLDTLQNKLLELHEKGCFEVELLPKGDDHTEMRIRYIPILPPDAMWKEECSQRSWGIVF